MKPKAIFSSLCRVQLLKFFCLGVVMAMISSPTSAAEFKTGQQLIEEGYRVMEQHELEAYLINRTVYTRVRKTNGELSKDSWPSYHHESGRRFVKIKNKIYETDWGFDDGMACYEGSRTGKWDCSPWYKKGDSVRICNPDKEKPCYKWDQSESRDGDPEGYMN
ncbi:MAG TPA: hypothetical protein DF863_05370 [Gammaproteobacteria bacterium]|nr:hypothetical protein [Gammaproteobacteria bacterium]